MAGKKKKSLASRLARMSDDERVKYLQRKAEMEDEIRRKREQLISTFMKSKLKKEDAFTRLNLAKINENWHQLLRKEKCKQMKETVQHLQKWITRTVDLKNDAIDKLMEELDDVEGIYAKNFKSHAGQIERIIRIQTEHLVRIREVYCEELGSVRKISKKERVEFTRRANSEFRYLRGIIYSQQVRSKSAIDENRAAHILKTDRLTNDYDTELAQMQKERQKISTNIWREISAVLKEYVKYTDSRRLHYVELKVFDEQNSAEVAANQQTISHKKEELSKLSRELSGLTVERNNQLKHLRNQMESVKRKFLHSKHRLQEQLVLDERQIKHLTVISNKTIGELETISGKGEKIMLLSQSCKKYETEREKVTRWAPLCEPEGEGREQASEEEESGDDKKDGGGSEGSGYKPLMSPRSFKKALSEGDDEGRSLSTSTASMEESSSVSGKSESGSVDAASKRKSWSKTTKPRTKPEKPILYRHRPLLPTIPQHPWSTTPLQNLRKSKSANSRLILANPDSLAKMPKDESKGYESLTKMEGLWWVYNKVKLDCMDMKQEREKLLEENCVLKETIRAVLEASALGQSIPTRRRAKTASSRRFVLSAPLVA